MSMDRFEQPTNKIIPHVVSTLANEVASTLEYLPSRRAGSSATACGTSLDRVADLNTFPPVFQLHCWMCPSNIHLKNRLDRAHVARDCRKSLERTPAHS